jgi:hypothetical protein
MLNDKDRYPLTLAIITTRKSLGLILQLSIISSSFKTLPEWINFIPSAGSSDFVASYVYSRGIEKGKICCGETWPVHSITRRRTQKRTKNHPQDIRCLTPSHQPRPSNQVGPTGDSIQPEEPPCKLTMTVLTCTTVFVGSTSMVNLPPLRVFTVRFMADIGFDCDGISSGLRLCRFAFRRRGRPSNEAE